MNKKKEQTNKKAVCTKVVIKLKHQKEAINTKNKNTGNIFFKRTNSVMSS